MNTPWLTVLSLLLTFSAVTASGARASATAASEAAVSQSVPLAQDAVLEPNAAQRQAQAVINGFHQALLAAATEHAEAADRFVQLAPLVNQVFNTGWIARLSLGRNWKTLGPEPQDQFRSLLSQLIAATYADRFAHGATVRFAVESVDTGRRGPVVRCQLIRDTGAPVRLDYHFRDGKIYNVVADGVSDLSLRRADYNNVVKQQGFDALLVQLRDQLQTLIGGETEPAATNEANS